VDSAQRQSSPGEPTEEDGRSPGPPTGKSRRRDPQALTFGTYRLVDLYTDNLVLGDPERGFGCDLDELEKYLTGDKS